MFEQVSRFHQTRANDAKAGAYYTDLSHVRSIGEMFVFPDKNICGYDPTCGNMAALMTVTEAATEKKLFGVELNRNTCEELQVLKDNKRIEGFLCGDVTNEVTISPKGFSICFANPPYLQDTSEVGANERVEKKVFDVTIDKIKIGGIMILVIPENRFFDEKSLFAKTWEANFETLAMYRFREPEYSRFKQGVFIGRRKPKTPMMLKEPLMSWIEEHKNLSILPEHPTERFEVPVSEDIEKFYMRKFDPTVMVDYLSKNGIPEKVQRNFNMHLTTPEYAGASLKRPPIPLKKDSEYLLLTSGYGGGLVGNEDEGTAHLFRAVADVVETETISDSSVEELDEDGNETNNDKARIIVTTHTQVEMRVLENDGTLTLLN